MPYSVIWTSKAAHEYAKLDNTVRQQIDKYLTKLSFSDDPRNMGKALTADLAGLWRYRVGDYRIVAQVNDAELIILILSVKHRSIVYRQK